MAFELEALKGILVCPLSKSALVREESALVCIDRACRRKYEIRDDIPIMLVDESVELDVGEWSAIMRKHGRDESGR